MVDQDLQENIKHQRFGFALHGIWDALEGCKILGPGGMMGHPSFGPGGMMGAPSGGPGGMMGAPSGALGSRMRVQPRPLYLTYWSNIPWFAPGQYVGFVASEMLSNTVPNLQATTSAAVHLSYSMFQWLETQMHRCSLHFIDYHRCSSNSDDCLRILSNGILPDWVRLSVRWPV